MRRGIDENVAVPKMGVKFVERVLGTLEGFSMIHMRRAEQAAIQPVGPAVVRALNPAREITLRGGTQARTPVPADVIKSFCAARIAAKHDNTFAGDLAQEIIARVGNAVRASGADPT